MTERKATALALLAVVAIFLFLQRHQPVIILNATAFALGGCWFWLCRRPPADRDAVSAFCAARSAEDGDMIAVAAVGT
jgi:hypothetical protein